MTGSVLRLKAIAAAAAVGLLVTGGALSAPPATAARASTLTIGLAEHGSTLNPFTANLDPDLNAIDLTYPALVWPNTNGVIVPYLADSWTTSADRLTWTFRLHPNLTWSDGQPLTATDVAWTLNLIRTNTAAATANGALVTNFASITAPDAQTVVIRTAKPQANMLYVVGLPIVPKHIWASRVSHLASETGTETPSVGYGPFRLKQYQTDAAITLSANPDFFLGAPKYATLVLQTYKDVDAAVLGLRNGDVDQVDKLTANDFNQVRKDAGVRAYQQVGNRWTGLEINPGAKSKTGKSLGTGNPILADARVRKAIAYGIDRKTLLTKVFGGLGEVGSGYLPPAFPQFSWQPSASQTVGYSPKQADAILDAAGYRRGGDGIRRDPSSGKALSFRFGIHTDDTSDTAISAYLVSWMRAIGIKLAVQPMSNTALNANLAKGDWDLLMDGWGTGPDPTYLLSIQTCGVLPDDRAQGGQTDAFFCDKTYDRLFAAQQQEFDPTKRAEMIKQMQQILYAANDDIILYYQNSLSAIRKSSMPGFIAGREDAKGFYPYQTYWGGYYTAYPTTTGTGGGSNTGAIVGVVVALVVIAGLIVAVTLRRRATAYDRP